MKWENVYIFISSTFNDMHAERDYLVKKVFPQLSAWCEERKLRLIDIDLRWGVSEADATQNKRVVQVCLDRIDACRPFFLCFLGQRRGWVPDKNDIGDDTYTSFPKLKEKYAGNTSVTEMEILHALVDPLQNAQSAEHTFFYLREPDYLKGLENSDLLDVYTNRAEADPAKADKELNLWREVKIPATGRPNYHYSAQWNANESTHEIALPLYCPTTAPIGSEAWKAAFEKWEKIWLSKGVAVSENGEITNANEFRKANKYNEQYAKGRLTDFKIDGKDLAEIVIENLKEAITARYGERIQQAETPLQKELDQQAQFLQVASAGFIERKGDFDAINDYLSSKDTCSSQFWRFIQKKLRIKVGNDTRPFALTAFAGMGKTSLLAHFIDTYQPKENETLYYRFIGGSDDSVSVERLVRSLLTELKEARKITSDIPPVSTDMMDKLYDLLAEAGKKGKTILIIDALNQLETGMDDLFWIPSPLPENIKMIVSFKRGEESTEEYYRQQEKSGTMILQSIKPFDSMEDRKKLVTAYLSRYFKELDDARIIALTSSEGAGNPLFLKAVLSELRVFGVHNDLTAMIRDNFGNTPVKAFDAILARMETDPAYSKIPPAISLPHILSWIAHSRYGLTVEELSDLLIREKLTESVVDANDAIYLVLRQLQPYFAKRDGRVDFFYESFKIAVTARYTANHPYNRTSTKWHRSLAEYFETKPFSDKHKLVEQAWQYAYAEMGENLINLLWNYAYIKNKILALSIEQLLNDYELVALSDINIQSEELSLLQRCLLLSFDILILHPDQLPERLFGHLVEENSTLIKNLLKEIKLQTKEIWLQPVNACFGTVRTRLITSRALNYGGGIDILSDNKSLVTYDDFGIKIWNIATLKLKRYIYIPVTKEDETSYFSITPDEKYAIIVKVLRRSRHSMILVIDISSGHRIQELYIEDSICIFASINGENLVSYSIQENFKRDSHLGHTESTIHKVTYWSIISGKRKKEKKKCYEGTNTTMKISLLPQWILSTELDKHHFHHSYTDDRYQDRNDEYVKMRNKHNSLYFYFFCNRLIFTDDDNFSVLHNNNYLELIELPYDCFNGLIIDNRLYAIGREYLYICDIKPPFIKPIQANGFRLYSDSKEKYFTPPLSQCKFSPDRKQVIYSDTVYDVATGNILLDFYKKGQVIHNKVQFSFDGNYVYVITNDQISEKQSFTGVIKYSHDVYLSIYEIRTGEMKKKMKIYSLWTRDFDIMMKPVNNDNLIISLGGSGFYLWNTLTEKPVKSWYSSFAIDVLNNYIVIEGHSENETTNIYLFDIEIEKVINTIHPIRGKGKLSLYNNSYYYILVPERGSSIEIWNFAEEKRILNSSFLSKIYIDDVSINVNICDIEEKSFKFLLENLPNASKVEHPSKIVLEVPIKVKSQEETIDLLNIKKDTPEKEYEIQGKRSGSASNYPTQS
jgi:hypothetical protein